MSIMGIFKWETERFYRVKGWKTERSNSMCIHYYGNFGMGNRVIIMGNFGM